MISPDADRIGLGQQAAGFLDPLAGLENVTEDNDPIHLFLAKAIQSRPQEFDVLVDVRNEAESHGLCSVIWRSVAGVPQLRR
jgi:hypothetical protein